MCETWLTFLCFATCITLSVPRVNSQSNDYPYRPSFHFVPLPKAWMNDPNGPFYDAKYDNYHLFFQYDPDGHGANWGHAVSKDLLHWKNLPIAIPHDDMYNQGGVWTGSITQTPDGNIYAIYAVASQNYICMATPTNLSDPYLTKWTEYAANCILNASDPDGYLPTMSRDPSGALSLDGGKSYNLIVAHDINNHLGGGGLNFYTEDFKTFIPNPNGTMIAWSNNTGWWDCVDWFPLPKSQQIADKNIYYVFKATVGADNSPCNDYGGYRDVWIFGDYNRSNGQFIPYAESMAEDPFNCNNCECTMDFGSVYAGKSFYDSKNDRQLWYQWITEERDTSNMNRNNGWDGVQTIPRVITLLDSKASAINEPMLVTYPIVEFEELRINQTYFTVENLNIKSGENIFFDENKIGGNELDIELVWQSGGDCGLYVLSDGEILNEYTRIGVNFYNEPNAKTVYIDTTMSSLDKQYQQFEHATQVPLRGWNGRDSVSFRIIVDHSVINVFVNHGEVVITRRAYPAKSNFYVGVYAWDHNDGVECTIRSLKAWNVTAVNPLPS